MKKFDLHTHTVYSDGVGEPRELFEWAKEMGLDGIAITDHDTVEGLSQSKKAAEEFGVELIPGIEVTTKIGDILGLGIWDVVSGDPKEIVEKIHELGGIAIIAHPCFLADVENMFKKLKDLELDAVEIMNANTPLPANAQAMKLAKMLNLPGTAGSDAHVPEDVGDAFTLCDSGSVGELLEKIKKGQVEVRWK